MARKKIPTPTVSHLSYCTGKGLAGDGTKATSTCPFHHSKQIEAVRYMCYYCCTGIMPSDIFADASGIHLENEKPITAKEPEAKKQRRPNTEPVIDQKEETKPKRGRGRPKGSKNMQKVAT